MFGQVIVDNQNVLALFHELFGHGTSSIGCNVLQRGRVRCTGVDYDGVGHGVAFFQSGHNLGDLTLLLADGHVDADQIAALLVDNRVDGYGGHQ